MAGDCAGQTLQIRGMRSALALPIGKKNSRSDRGGDPRGMGCFSIGDCEGHSRRKSFESLAVLYRLACNEERHRIERSSSVPSFGRKFQDVLKKLKMTL
jgi:hypothetical protein